MAKINGLISPEEAKKLNDAYTPRFELISKDILGKPDSRSSWWSLQDLKNYLEYAERQAKELGYEMNGIRIYNGAYPKTQEGAGYSTSFIVPTARNIDGKDSGGSNGDIPDGDALNDGQGGYPPGANYPQQ